VIYRLPVRLAVLVALIFVAGGVIGADVAMNGNTNAADVVDRMEDDMFTADGELDPNAAADPPAWLPALDVGPETPQIDAAIRRGLIAPTMRLMLVVVGAGATAGVTLVDTVGVTVTRWLFQLSVVGLVAGYGVYVVRRFGVLERFGRRA